MSGVADIAPYTAGGQRLALAPIRFGPGPGGSTALSTVAQLDGPFPDGRVQALRLPIDGRIGRGGSFAFGTSCAVVSFNYLQIERAAARRDTAAGLPDRAGDRLQAAGRPGAPPARGSAARCSNGRLGSSPFHLAAARRADRRQAIRLQPPRHAARQAASPIAVRRRAADRHLRRRRHQRQLQRRAGDDRQRPAAAQRRRRATGSFRNGDLSVDSALTVSDRDRQPALLSAAERRRALHAGRRLCPRDRRAAPSGERHAGHRRQHRASPVDRRRPRDCSTCRA